MNRNSRRILIPAPLTRTVRGAVIALALALVVAAPAAAATTPTRVVYDLHPFVIPAGYACAFDVAGRPDWGFVARTTLPNGTIQSSVRAHGAYVNVATGATFPTADNFRAVDDIDPVTGIDTVTINGEVTDSFLPGDDGPFGTIAEASFYKFVGTIWFTYDPNTNQQTDFGYRGTVEDVCAALS
jgi:hypothetical protein